MAKLRVEEVGLFEIVVYLDCVPMSMKEAGRINIVEEEFRMDMFGSWTYIVCGLIYG